MDIHVGRQPILDRRLRTFGYELLFRAGMGNDASVVDDVTATATVIVNTFLSLGLDQVVGRSKSFVNFPRQFLVDDAAIPAPAGRVVVEVLEDVPPDREVVLGCRRLKRAGFLLALDDFAGREDYAPLVDLADFIKVDFRCTPAADRLALVRRFRPRGIRMLAEKIETDEEFCEAREAGYDYFQGYFFARPQVISARDVPAAKLRYLQILRAVHAPEVELDEVESLIRAEVTLAHKLLRYVNSAAFHLRTEAHTLRQAIVLLGEQGLCKWLSLIAVAGLVSDRSPELVRLALCRARFCEMVAAESLPGRDQDGFLMGLFSLLDAMMGRPMEELLAQLGLSSDVRAVLVSGGANSAAISGIYELSLAAEQAESVRIRKYASQLGLSWQRVAEIEVESMAWCERMTSVAA